ncbi:MAG: hypothetical protein AAFR53_16305 [Pseudomonadota bacterium]
MNPIELVFSLIGWAIVAVLYIAVLSPWLALFLVLPARVGFYIGQVIRRGF